jgi:hypothetical protein
MITTRGLRLSLRCRQWYFHSQPHQCFLRFDLPLSAPEFLCRNQIPLRGFGIAARFLK